MISPERQASSSWSPGNTNGTYDPESALPMLPEINPRSIRAPAPPASAPTMKLWLNWGTVILLGIIAVSMEKAAPREAYIRKDILPMISYPLFANTVPSWAVPVIAIPGPIAVFALLMFLGKVRASDMHTLTLALLTAVLLTGAITNCIKAPVGRMRPDFVARCWPEGKLRWSGEDQFGGYADCDGVPALVREGRKSFPSGKLQRAGGAGVLAGAHDASMLAT
jgi:diacylglycerol diphosphate phosphatase/phosphatidate phosphatase